MVHLEAVLIKKGHDGVLVNDDVMECYASVSYLTIPVRLQKYYINP